MQATMQIARILRYIGHSKEKPQRNVKMKSETIPFSYRSIVN